MILDCRTKGGNVSNMRCVFPFIYHGIEFLTCTGTNNDGVQWCATKTDDEGNYIGGQWGNCGEGCPGSRRINYRHILKWLIF